jgi:hypothetical protein
MKTLFSPKFLQFLLLPLFVFVLNVGWGQTITAGNSYVQNFDAIGTTATATLPTGWKAETSTTFRSVITAYSSLTISATALALPYNSAMTSSASNGIYNFGSGASSGNQAVGGLSSSSASKTVNMYLKLTNNSASTSIPSFTISYNANRFRNGSNTAGFSIRLYYSTTGAANSWTEITAGALSFTANADNNGSTTNPSETKTATNVALAQSLAASGSIYFAWSYSVTSGTTTSNAQALAIDDISINATAAPTPTITGSATATAFTTTFGTASSAQTFSVSGSNLTANLVATAPSGFEVSSDGTTYGATASFTQTSGSASGTLSVRLKATAAVTGTSYNGVNIQLTSTGATPVNITTASSGNIVSAKGLTITGLTGANKTYDGSTFASATGTAAYSGLVNSESFSVTGTPSFSFASAAVGTGKTITVTGYSAPSANYSISQPAGLTADITAKSLTITANNITKTEGATLTGGAGSTAFTSSGLVSSESIGSVTIAYGNGAASNDLAGTYTNQVTPSLALGGTFSASNYSITYVQGNIIVEAAPASPTITASLSTFASAFSTTYGTASTAQSFSVSGAALTGDLTLTAPTGFEISLSNSTGYTASLNLVQSSGAVASTTIYARIAATSAAGSYNSSSFSVSGGGATTVTIAATTSNNTVAQKALTISGLSAANKSYNGNTNATLSGTAAYSGLANSESFAVVGSATATFASANVANGIAVTVTGFSAPSANYSITQPSFTANITAVNLTISGISIANKTYDNSTTATITGTAAYQGTINNESFAVTGTPAAVFASVNVGNSIAVTVTGYTAPSANYTLTQPTGLTANITAANQTITFNALTNQTTATVVDYAPGATSPTSAVNAITYTSSNTAVATIVGGLIHIVGAGTATITASQAGNGNYNVATSVAQNLVVTLAPVTLANWNFGTTAPGSAVAAGVASNIAVSALVSGNSFGYTTLLGTTSASNNSGASGSYNAGVAANVGALDVGLTTNAYFEFTMTPNTGYYFSLTNISFGSRSTGTGPVAYSIRSSANGYASDLALGSLSNASNWAAYSTTGLNLTSAVQTAVTFRIYGYNGTGSPGSGSINWRIDDLKLTGNVIIAATPPTLTADATANTVDNNIDITFTEDATWTSAITAVKIGATTLTPTTDYVISPGNIQLKPSGLNTLLTAAGTKAITVVATGYSDATVSQVINAGVPTSNSTATISAILAAGATRTITCTAKDQYSNLVSGYTFKYDAAIVALNATISESYVIDVASTSSTLSDINLTATTNASGVATFDVQLPSLLDANDGISIQVQLANGSTNVGSAFAYYELPGQTITFNALNAVTYGDAAFTVSASGGASGNPVVFTSSNNAVATCTGTNGTTVTIIGVGTATISANQAGNAGYNAAATVSQSLTVNQKALTISGITGANKIYNGTTTATFTGTPAYVGLVNGQSFSVSGTATAVFSDTNAGTGKTITVTGYTAPSANYSLTQPTLTADITQAAQTISFASLPNRAVGGASYALGATSSSSATNPISYVSSNTSVATISGNTVTIVGAGSTTITASQAGNINYSAATSVAQIQTIIALPIAAWDFYGQTSPATFAATTFNSNLEATSPLSEITRGSGAASNGVANAFSTTGFQNNGISTANTDYFQVTIKAKSGYLLSLSEINANFDGTISFYATPGVTSQYAYSLNGTDFTLIGSPITSASLKPDAVDLTGVSALQNLSVSTTVTIRYYASGQTNTGGWRFSSPAAGVPGLAIGGSFSCALPIAPTAGNSSRCGTGTVAISATPGTGETIDWYSSASGGTALWTGATSYTTPIISATTIYYAEAKNTTTGCASSTRTPVTATVNTLPSAPTAGSTSRCGTGTVTLSASAATGETTDWYEASTGGSPLAQAIGQYTTPTLTSTTTYYVEGRNITTGCVSATRTAVTVTINTPAVPSVTIASSDADNSICPSEEVIFTATASNGGSAPTYQWKLNGSNVSGSGSTYTNAALVNSDVVTVVMTANNSCQSASTATSNAITTVVNATPAALSVTGSTYCSYSNGVVNTTLGSVTSTSSASGVGYTLYNVNGDAVSASVPGTGSSLTWTGVEAATGYYVIGVNTTTGCIGSTSSATQVSVTSATIPLYTDTDGDNYGAGSISGYACVALAPSGYSLNTSDCNTTNSAINPGAVEICGNNIDENCSGNTDDIPAYFRSRASGNWGDATTWQFACSPSDTYQNSIYAPPANYTGYVNVLNGHTVTVPNNGTVYQTGTLDVDAGGTLTMTGNDYNNDPTTANVSAVAKLTVTLVIINDGTMNVGHQASLVQTATTAGTVNSGSGNFNVQSKLTGTWSSPTGAPNGRYWYIGSPMNNTVASQFYDTPSMVRLWSYNAGNNSWGIVIHSQTSTNSSLKLVPGIGYLYRGGTNKTITYTSTAANLNNNITTNLLAPASNAAYVPVLSYSTIGYKFVANPYPSHVDWTLLSRTGLNAGYWIRNSTNTSYDAYNATTQLGSSSSGQTTKYIAPMQGFWVYAYTTPCALKIDNTDRVHSTNVLHAPVTNHVVRLKLNNGESSDYTVVYENELAANDFEETDTDKMFDYDFHQLYTLEGEHELSLNGLLNATSKGSVNMGLVVPNNGAYTLEATDLGVEEDVMLEDKFNHTFQDMKMNPIYSFTSNAGTFNERFVLHFTATESVAVTETESASDAVKVFNTSNKQVKVWVSNTTTEYQGATVKVYDAIGNLVDRKNMTSNELLLDLDIANGIYVVEVTGDSKVFTKKIFISK